MKQLEHPSECEHCGQFMDRGTMADVWYSSMTGQWKAGHPDKKCPPVKEKRVRQQNIRRDPDEYERAHKRRFPHEVKCGKCGERMVIPRREPFPPFHNHPRCGGQWIVGGDDPDAIEVGSETHRELVAAQRRARVPATREDFLRAPQGHTPTAEDDIPF